MPSRRTALLSLLVILGLGLLGACNSGSSSGDSSGGPITGTVTLDEFSGFTPMTTVLDAEAGPGATAVEDELYLAEGPIPFSGPATAGLIRVVDFETQTQLRGFAISNTDLPNTVSMGSLHVASATLGLVLTKGQPSWETAWLFHPQLAAGPNDVTSVDLSFSIDPGGRANSDGNVNNPYTAGQAATARVVGSKLYVAMASFFTNSSSEPSYHPGIVLVFDLNLSTRTVTNPTSPAVIFTNHYNPASMEVIPATDGGSDFLAVVNTGEFTTFGVHTSAFTGSVDFIDTSQDAIVMNVPLGDADPGAVAVDTSRERLYLGSSSGNEVFAVDYAGLESLRGATTVTNAPGRVVHGPSNPVTVTVVNGGGSFLVDLEMADSDTYLYVVNYNDSTLTAFDLTELVPTEAGQFTQFASGRSGSPTNFENQLNFVEVRHGSFLGPDLWGVTINVPPSNGLPQDVSAVVDSVDTSPR